MKRIKLMVAAVLAALCIGSQAFGAEKVKTGLKIAAGAGVTAAAVYKVYEWAHERQVNDLIPKRDAVRAHAVRTVGEYQSGEAAILPALSWAGLLFYTKGAAYNSTLARYIFVTSLLDHVRKYYKARSIANATDGQLEDTLRRTAHKDARNLAVLVGLVGALGTYKTL